MKLGYNQIESFARNFNPAQRGVLIYGPDHGLVQERAREVLAKVLGNPDDPFAMTDLTGGAIKDDPALLFDEVSAMAFFGGRKVIRIREDAEKAAEALKGLFVSPPSGKIEELGFVLVLADELDKRSALRLLFEGATDAAALPCYVDESVGVSQLIREEFKRRQIIASSDAIAYLSNVLRGDRLMVRMEMEKIDLYLGAERDLSLDAARECTGDLAESSADEIADAVSLGDIAATDKHLKKALGQGAMPIMLLRSVSRHFQRFVVVANQMENGTSLDQSIAQMRPPMFFKQQPIFKRQMGFWNKPQKINKALNLLYQAELRIKTSGLDAELVTERALSGICRQASLR